MAALKMIRSDGDWPVRFLRGALAIPLTIRNWPSFLADLIGLSCNGYLVCRLRNGLKFRLRTCTTDSLTLMEIWMMRDYSLSGFEIRGEDTVVDVGAHIGLFSLMAANRASKGMVYALEPNSRNFGMLLENVEINQAKNVVPINAAVGHEDGRRMLYLSPENASGHSFYCNTRKEGELVKTLRLETLFDDYKICRVDYLKMDCEGAEYEILGNCPPSVLRKVKRIALEYHAAGNLTESSRITDLRRVLLENGFNTTVNPTHTDRGMLYAVQIGYEG